MTRTRAIRYHVPAVALALSLAACDEAAVAPDVADVAFDHAAHDHSAHADRPAHAGTPVRAHGDLFKAVRQETSRFNSTTQATRAGYVSPPGNPCVEHPGKGGMGYHWVNGPLIDPVFEPMKPEALLYAPGPGGNLRLVGVEYIVIDVGQPHPDFDGYPFDVGGVPFLGDTPHYSLHVWVHEHNPAGDFEPYNPNVSCN